MGVRNLTIAFAFFALTCNAEAQTSAETIALETFASLAPGQSIGGLESFGMAWQSDDFITVAAPANCRADINADGVVNGHDLAEVVSRWSTTSIAADLDFSGAVDAPDLAALLAAWGDCAAQAPTIAAATDPIATPSAFVLFASALTETALRPPANGAIQIIFDYRPVQDEATFFTHIAAIDDGFVTVSLGADHSAARPHYTLGGVQTGKPIVFDEWVTVVYELSRPGESNDVFERTLLRDSQTVAEFGPEPVEVYPAGPYGPALSPSTGEAALNPSPSVFVAWNQVSWVIDAAIGAGSESCFDNLRIRRMSNAAPR